MVEDTTEVARTTSHIEDGCPGVEERKEIFQGVRMLYTTSQVA